MKMISLSGSLTSKDSFNSLLKRNNPIAKQIAAAASNADSFQRYALEQWEASNAYNGLMTSIADKKDPRVVEAADRLRKAEAALRSNKGKYDANVKKFQELLPKLEAEYNKTKASVAQGAAFNREYPPKPTIDITSINTNVFNELNNQYDPNYARANNIWYPPRSNPDAVQSPDSPPIAPPIIKDPERVPTETVNRRPQPPKPKKKPAVKRGPKLSTPRGTTQNNNIIATNRGLDGNIGLGTGPCPPGSTGRGIQYGCTTPDGATFIA